MITASYVRQRHEGQVDSPAFPGRPDVTTVMAQAAVGYIAGNFLLLLARILLVPNPRNFMWIFFVPALPVFAVPAGLTVGLFIWAGFEMAGNTLNSAYRSIIAAMMIALAYLAILLVFGWPWPPPEMQFWVLGMILAPAIGIGLITGSRLRLWHELVRKGDPVGPVLAVLAGLTGVVLRLTVAFFYMVSLVTLIGVLQSPGPQQIHLVWWILMFVHFAAGGVLVFVRLKTDALLPLAVIANAPVIAVLIKIPEVQYVAIGYLALWAVFLLTRWRQTQAAFSVLKEEFRYYLID